MQKKDTIHLKLYGKVYDLTNFKHPGGRKFIEYASKTPDATPLFESHHLESELIKKDLGKYEIKGQTYEQVFSPNSWTEGFYPEIKKEVLKWTRENKQLIEKEKRKYKLGTYLLILIYYISLAYVLFGNLSFFSPLNLFLCVVVGWIKPIVIGIAHNYLHKDKVQSFLFGLGFMDLSEWEWEHVFLHHPFTNTKYDIDFANIQKIFKLPVPLRMFGIWMKMVVLNPLKRSILGFRTDKWEYFLNWLIPFVELVLFVYTGKILCFLFMITVSLNYFLNINFSNHYIKPIHYDDAPVNDWATQQLISSEDFYIFDYGFFDSLLAIGLCFQSTHHLFPKIDHCLLPFINPIVERLTKKYKIPLYKPNFLFANIPRILHMLHTEGTPCNLVETPLK